MNRKLLLFCALTLPLFLLAVVAQSVVYHDLNRQLEEKTVQQALWLEKNKKLLAGVTVLESPARVEALARDELGLVSVGAEGTVKVRFPSVSGAVK